MTAQPVAQLSDCNPEERGFDSHRRFHFNRQSRPGRALAQAIEPECCLSRRSSSAR